MDRYDARKETFEEIEIFDTLALFSTERIQRGIKNVMFKLEIKKYWNG